MYTFEEMRAVAATAQEIVGVVSKTGRIKAFAVVKKQQLASCIEGDGDIESSDYLEVTFDWLEGRWQLSGIMRY